MVFEDDDVHNNNCEITTIEVKVVQATRKKKEREAIVVVRARIRIFVWFWSRAPFERVFFFGGFVNAVAKEAL